jgi:hypothetical protein
MTERLEIETRPLSLPKRFLYGLLSAIGKLPVLRYMGQTITVVGQKT